MNDNMLLLLGIFVFVMLCVGLGLTVWEFRQGQPHKDQLMAKREKERQLEPA
jgi:hypothetical protein